MINMRDLSLGLLLLTTLSTNVMAMRFSTKVSESHIDTIKDDLQYLENTSIEAKTNVLYQKIFGMDKIDGEKLSTWLDKRLHYIVEEDYDPIKNENVFILGKIQKNEASDAGTRNKIVSLNSTEALAEINSINKAYVVMSNYGTGLYMTSISYKYLLGVELETVSKGVERIIIDSPRVGIAKIGEGLFRSMLNPSTIAKYNITNDEIARMERFSRIKTYLHEARHSDGNGDDLGMGHSKCPKNHDYAGYYACEDAVNGPYGINASLSFEQYANCTDCSDNEKLFSQMLLADGCSRIVEADKQDMCENCDDTEIQKVVTKQIMTCVKTMTEKDITKLPALLKANNYKVRKESPETVLDATGI